jgi:GntR family transcriptional regulator
MPPPAGRSRGPSYTSVADRLEREIAALAPNDRVASEHELAERFGVSRVTTRSALQELERRLVVRRVRGSGTFVAPRLEYVFSPDTPPSWRAVVRSLGHEPTVDVLVCEERPATASERRTLGLAGGHLLHLIRRGSVDGLPASVSEHRIPIELVGDGVAALAAGDSVHAVLEAHGCRPARLHTSAEIEVAPADIGHRLGLDGRPLMWRVSSTNVCRRCGRTVETNEAWMRADVFRLRFELQASRPVRPPTPPSPTSRRAPDAP